MGPPDWNNLKVPSSLGDVLLQKPCAGPVVSVDSLRFTPQPLRLIPSVLNITLLPFEGTSTAFCSSEVLWFSVSNITSLLHTGFFLPCSRSCQMNPFLRCRQNDGRNQPVVTNSGTTIQDRSHRIGGDTEGIDGTHWNMMASNAQRQCSVMQLCLFKISLMWRLVCERTH